MNIKRTELALLAGAAMMCGRVRQANADEWDQKTKFTFSGPVEIPGQVLPPGTYVFKLADSQADRNIVQVYNKDEKHLIGTFLAIPDQRLRPAGKPIITFEERAADAPEAIKAWFYPGENYGHQFVYPKEKAVALAKTNNTPVPSMPTELAANTTKPAVTMTEPHVVAMRQAPLMAQQPTEEEVDIAEIFLAPPPQPDPGLPAQLPSTASSLPLTGLLGLCLFGVACISRFAAVRSR